jgi:hypothetical protein
MAQPLLHHLPAETPNESGEMPNQRPRVSRAAGALTKTSMVAVIPIP